MSEEKIVVPDGMMRAMLKPIAYNPDKTWEDEFRVRLEAALRWLSENAPLPTEAQCNEMWRAVNNYGDRYCQEWVRRMFLAPEPEVPEAIKDLMEPQFTNALQAVTGESGHNRCILEAYKRGRESK